MLIDTKKNGIIHEYIYEDIIEEGNQFKKSADILFWNWTRTNPPEPLTFPALVCYAFSCELYLKGLSKKYKDSFKMVHNITLLYNELPLEIKNNIKELINSNNFEKDLNSINNLFEESRYFFDTEKFGKKNPNINFVVEFSKVLCEVANKEIVKKEI